PDLWFLAMDGDEIAGVSLCRKWSIEVKENGYVGTFGVRKPWRKQGLGQALLQHSFQLFHQRDYRKVALHVDASSLTGAVRLYEKSGMHVFRQYDRYELERRPGIELGKMQITDE
ncbi:MAG: GNAT family N-acetyltransferase, partial [Chloroflexota bacterium]